MGRLQTLMAQILYSVREVSEFYGGCYVCQCPSVSANLGRTPHISTFQQRLKKSSSYSSGRKRSIRRLNSIDWATALQLSCIHRCVFDA
jgi:hypothetical protein